MPRHGSADSTGEVDIVDPEPRRSGMAQWSIRSKLLLLAMIPLTALLAGGTLVVVSIGLNYVQARHARQYADAVIPAVAYTAAMNAELNGAQLSAGDLGTMRSQTDERATELREGLKDISGANPRLSNASDAVLQDLGTLKDARQRYDALASSGALTTNQLKTNTDKFNTGLTELVSALNSELSSVTPDRSTADDASLVSALNLTVINANDEQRLIRNTLLNPTGSIASRAQELAGYQAREDLGLNEAKADLADVQSAASAISTINSDDSALLNWRTEAGSATQTPTTAQQVSNAKTQSRNWNTFATERAGTVAGLAGQVAQKVSSDSRDTERNTLLRAAGVAAAGILLLLVVTTLLATIARSVTTPLRRLRAGAVEIASVQLPAAVARIEQDGVAADVSLPPVLPADSPAGPETFEVARAVDDLGAEAVRLATAQVRLRRALDEAFVSMSRRSQSMVEKQLTIIDELESQEQDPDQLRNLFRLDHLAARMRRYNDNLLVLAGSAVRTRATAPVKVAELFRAATSEMEQYERVRLQPVSGASVAGTVTGELVHLLAELLDNAAMYSPPSSSIGLSAAFTADGGLQIEVVDAGVGISPGEIDRLNARLTQPEAIDTQVPSRMGLFVVARLARRGGFGVLLQARPDAAGTLALVRVPPQLVIGAPGNTGESPAMPSGVTLRPTTPGPGVPAGIGAGRASFGNAERPAAVQARAAVARASGANQTPPGAGQGSGQGSGVAAAAAAAGVRSVPDAGGALPRRRRGGAVAPDGRPVNAQPPVGDDSADLFTPALPAEGAPPAERRDLRRPAAKAAPAAPAAPPGPAGPATPADPAQPAAAAPPAGTISRSAVPPAETSPSGIPLLRPPSREAVPPAAAQIAAQIAAHDAAKAAPVVTGPSSALPVRNGRSGQAAALRGPAPQSPASQPPAPQGRTPQNPLPERPRPADPLTSPTGAFRSLANPALPGPGRSGNGSAPAAWDEQLPTELAARAAAASAYTPPDPSLIGESPRPGDDDDPTPIFDQISVWFTAEPTGGIAIGTDQLNENGGRVIDLREQNPRQPSTRWASLGDQRWLATSAQAAAAPLSEGTTEQGLPLRRPGANLLPSASGVAGPPAAAPARPPAAPAAGGPAGNPAAGAPADGPAAPGPEADAVRGRLGSYQRGLADARRARNAPAPEPAYDPVGASLFTASGDPGSDSESRPTDQGGAH